MARQARRTLADLTDAVRQVAPEASFFELLRVLEALAPGAAPLAGGGSVRDEAIRLRGHLSAAFPRRDLEAVDTVTDDDRERLRLEVTFLTLYGPDSPLPPGDTIKLLQAEDDRARDFLDVLDHRLLTVLYRAWARSRPHTGGAGWASTPAGQVVTALVDPIGQGARAWRRADLRFAGRRSASGLARAVRALLPGRPVRVETCVPQRVAIPPDQRCQLGRGASRLGEDCVLGGTTWDATGRFRVHVGPLDRADFEALTPGGALHRALTEVIDGWTNTPLAWRLRVTLRGDAASPARLGGEGAGRRLGVDTWLGKPGDRLQTTELDPYRPEGVLA